VAASVEAAEVVDLAAVADDRVEEERADHGDVSR
jgi:hypothetical protein